MRLFSIKTVFRKLFFCCTQCVCIKRFLKKRSSVNMYDGTPDMTKHPIYDLEKGEL